MILRLCVGNTATHFDERLLDKNSNFTSSTNCNRNVLFTAVKSNDRIAVLSENNISKPEGVRG